jgi:endoglucanase
MIPTRRLFTCLLLFCVCQQGSGQGFLKAQGRLIVNEKGEKVILRGIGLGGWMLQEGYMLKLGKVGPQYRIREKITELVGPEKAAAFYDRWLANDIRKVDIDSMAAWGFNSVRLPMHYALYTLPVDEEPVAGKNTWVGKGWALTDSLLSWCKADHIYLILDMHAAPGGQGNDLNIADRDPSKSSLWESADNREKMVALWRKLAEHYVNEPWIGGYDIINEPNWGFSGDTSDMHGTKETGNAPLRQLMVEITTAIRSVDKRHIIIIEGNGWGNNYRGILPAWDDNMVLSFHKYWNPNTEDAIRGFLNLREKYNIPLWLGESGENNDQWFHDAVRLAEGHDIGWSWWPLKKIGTSQPLEVIMPPAFQKLVDCWVKSGPRPTEQEAEEGLNALVENIRLENNIVHRDVLNALFLP